MSPLLLAAYTGSALFFLLLLFREKTTSHPMLPLALFQERTFSATNVVAVCQTFTITGFIFVMSLFFQQVKHYSPSLTGLALLPAFGIALVATSLSGLLMGRIGSKRVMVIGLLLSAVGCFGFVLIDTQTSYVLLACLLAVLGGGLALVLPADRGCDFAYTESTIRDSSGNAECEQASWRCHRGRDPGNVCGESADVPLGHASRLRDRRRGPRVRVGSCMGLCMSAGNSLRNESCGRKAQSATD